jgi:hypothetical protein
MPAPRPETHALPHVLYRAYDRLGRLVYVGITANWEIRLYNHQVSTYWWKREIVRTRLIHWPDRAAALEAERQAIRVEQPMRNSQHNRRPRTYEQLALIA